MFKEKITDYLKEKGVIVSRVEQEGDNKSIVCHISESDNAKMEEMKEEMEKSLDVAVMGSQNYGMNVYIVEANDMEE